MVVEEFFTRERNDYQDFQLPSLRNQCHATSTGCYEGCRFTSYEGLRRVVVEQPRSRWLRDLSFFYDQERGRDLHNVIAPAETRVLDFSSAT